MADENNKSLDNVYDDEFDGLKANEERSVRKVDDEKNETVYGLPLNIDSISPIDEFDPTTKKVTRTMELDIRPAEQQPVEFDAGASFAAESSLFALSSPPSTSTVGVQEQAPPIPFYLKVSKTSFHSSKSISVLKPEIEQMFAKNAVKYSSEPNSPFFYDCSMVCLLSLIEFEVRIFSSDKKHLVEFRHLSGCRYGFGEAYKTLAEPFVPVKSFAALKPPPLFLDNVDDELSDLSMPTLQKSVDYEMSMLSDDKNVQAQMNGARVVGSADDMDFSDDGFGLPLANRLTELASSKTEDDELRVVAFGSIAKLTRVENISNDWLNGAVNTIVEAVGDDHPHIRRQALQSLETMAKRDNTLATKFVVAGVVPLLEHEEAGGSEDQSPDLVAQGFARQALLACRA
jgi:hypothetical protein